MNIQYTKYEGALFKTITLNPVDVIKAIETGEINNHPVASIKLGVFIYDYILKAMDDFSGSYVRLCPHHKDGIFR